MLWAALLLTAALASALGSPPSTPRPAVSPGADAAPRGQLQSAVLARNSRAAIRLDGNVPIPDGTGEDLVLGISPVPNTVRVNASAGARVLWVDSPDGDASYAAGDSFELSVRFSAPVVVDSAELALRTGCHSDACHTPEVQELYCLADSGQFRLHFDGAEVSVPAGASPDEVKYAIEGAFPDVREVDVAFSGLRNDLSSEPSTWRACGDNNISVTFVDVDRWGPGEHGDLPALTADPENLVLDPHSLAQISEEDSRLQRAAGGDPQLSGNATEVVKGVRYNDRVAAYARGNGTDTLVFSYVVQHGDASDDLEYSNASALTLTSRAMVIDATLPPPGALLDSAFGEAASLAANRDIVLDTAEASLASIGTPLPDGKYGQGQEVPIVLNFTRPITLVIGTGAPYLLIDAGFRVRTAPLTDYDETSLTFTYTALLGDYNVDLDLVENNQGFQLNGSSVYTRADTLEQLAVIDVPEPYSDGSIADQHDIFITDEVPYVLAVTGASPDGTYTAGDSIEVVVVFSLEVDAVGTPFVQLATGENRLLWDVVSAPTDGNATVVRFPGGHGLSTEADRGRQFLVGDQVMTVAAVSGDRVTMEEPWTGPNISLSTPLTHIYAPGARPAYYASGSGSKELHFIYDVQPGDVSPDLDVFNKTGMQEGHGHLYRAATTPSVPIERDLPDPGSVASLAFAADYVVNTETPRVLNVSTTKLPGTYGAGELVDVWVRFSLPVVVDNADDDRLPAMLMGVNPLPGYDRGSEAPGRAFYHSGSGTHTLLLLYEVGPGDEAAALDAAGEDALDVAYGNAFCTVRRLAATPTLDANLTLSSSLSGGGLVAINASAPTVVSVAPASPAGTYRVGAAVIVRVTFSAAVFVTGSPRILMTSGGYANYNQGSGTTVIDFEYVVADGDELPSLDVEVAHDDYLNTTTIDLNGGAIRGATAVTAAISVAPFAEADIAVTSAPPAVTAVWSEKPAGTYGAGENISVAVTFDQPVLVLSDPLDTLLELDLGDFDVNVSLARVDTADNLTLWFDYVVLEGHGSSDLDFTGSHALVGDVLLLTDYPSLRAELALPVRGQVGSLAWQSDIAVDTQPPYVTAVSVSTTDTLGLATRTQVLAVTGSAGELRLAYGPHLVTPCFAHNASAAELQAVLQAAYNVSVAVERHNQPFVDDTHEFHITFTDHAFHHALELAPNDDEVQCAAGAGAETAAAKLQPGRGAPRDGLLEIALHLSATTDVRQGANPPLLQLSNGAQAELSAGRVQHVDVGAAASAPMTFGQYQLSYNGDKTGCIAWDSGAGSGPLSLRSALLELPAVRLLGIESVATEARGNGLRHTVTFASGAPLGLVVENGTAAGCREPVPADARAERPAALDVLRFYYAVGSADGGDLRLANSSALLLRGAVLRRNSTQPVTALDPALPEASLDLGVAVDTTPAPSVAFVNLTTAGATHGAGDLLTFQVWFDAPVTITSTHPDERPVLQLAAGANRAYWDPTQSPTADVSALTFVYEVEDGDDTSDLDVDSLYHGGALITAGGGSFVDANLTLPAGDRLRPSNVVLNTTAPRVVAMDTSTSTGVYGEGQVIDIDVTLSRPVAVTGEPVLELNVPGRNATLTRGSQVQFIDVDATGGEFMVEYDGERTDCVAYNSSSDLYDKLAALDNLPVADIVSVSLSGNRFRVAFEDYTNPASLEPVADPYLCAPLGTPGRLGRPFVTVLTFRYVVKQYDYAEELNAKHADALRPVGGYIRHLSDRPTTPADLELPVAGGLGSRVTVNGSTPIVADVFSVSGEGPFGPGDVVQIAVQLTAPVLVSGTPRLELDSGGPAQNQTAVFVGGDGSSTLLFEFTVSDLDSADDLDYISTTSLRLDDGASITRVSSTPTAALDVRLPVPGESGSLSAEQDVVLAREAEPQILSVDSPTPNGVYGAGEDIHIDVHFARPVIVTDGLPGPELVLSVGRTNATYAGAVNEPLDALRFLYTVQPLDATDMLDVGRVALHNDSAIEAYTTPGVAADLALPAAANLGVTRNITIDTSEPYVTGVDALTDDGYYGLGQEIVLQVHWSAPVAVVGGDSRLRLETGGAPEFDARAEFSGGNGTSTLQYTYVVEYGDRATPLEYDGTGALREELDEGAQILRASTNPVTAVDDRLPDPRSELATASDVFVDYALIPRAQVVTTNGSTTYEYARNEQVFLQLSFDHAVTVAGEPFITLHVSDADPELTARATYLSGDGTNELTFVYTVEGEHQTQALRYADTRVRATQTFTEPVDLNSGTIRLVSTTPTADAVLRLPLPGAAGSLSNVTRIMVDGSVPSVAAVWSSAADRAYGAGEVIPIFLNFTDAVEVEGVPRIAMDSGTLTDTDAVYVGGSGSSVLEFEYEVAAGDDSDLLDYKDANALRLWEDNRERTYNTHAVITRAGSPLYASVQLPAPGPRATVVAPASLEGSGHRIVVETGDLTVAEVTADQPDGTYGVGEVLVVNVRFGADVAVTGAPYIDLDFAGRQALFRDVNGSVAAFEYQVADGDDTDLVDYLSTRALVLPGNSTIVGVASGKPATVTLPELGAEGSLGRTRAIAIDTAAPVVTAVSLDAAGVAEVGVGHRLDFTVHFSAPVVVHGWWPSLALSFAEAEANYTRGSGSDAIVFSYVVAAGDGVSVVDVANASALVGTLLRESTNPTTRANTTLPTGALTGVTVDTTAPVVTEVYSDARPGVLVSGASIDVVVAFSAPVFLGGDLPSLALEVGRQQAAAAYVSGNGTSALTLRYTAAVGDSTSDLDYESSQALSGDVLRLATYPTQAADLTLPAPGRAASLGHNADIVVFGDATRPANVSSTTPSETYAEGDTLELTVTFTMPTTLSADATLALNSAEDVVAVLTTPAADMPTLTHTFDYLVLAGHMANPLDYASVEALSASSLRDSAGNLVSADLPAPGDAGSLSGTRALIVDTTPPYVTGVDSSAATTAVGYGEGEYLLFSVAFSEPVVVFEPAGLALLLDTGAGEARSAAFLDGNGTRALRFEYTVLAGDDTRDVGAWGSDALDTSGGGRVLRLSAAPSTAAELAVPVGAETPGSLLYNANVRLDTSTPAVESVAPLNADGLYVLGDTVFVGVQFTLPVAVSGAPTLELDVGNASFYGMWGASDSMVAFNLTVAEGALSEFVVHASPLALQLPAGAWIRRASSAPTTDADLVLPDGHDPTARELPFREVAGVELVLRGLYHPHAADLSVTLAHAGRTCDVVLPGSAGSRRVGSPLEFAYPDPRLYDPPEVPQSSGAAADLWLADRGGPNLALLGQASQSSTGFGGVAERAIDGDANPWYSGDSVTHTAGTESEGQPWWQVRLDEESTVGAVVVWNRELQPPADEVQTLHTYNVYRTLRISGGEVNVTVANETLTMAWDESADGVTAKLEELDGVGNVVVTRSDSPRTEGGYVWSVTFLDERENLPEMQAEAALSTVGSRVEVRTVRNGNDNEWYRYKRQGVADEVAARIAPAWVMLFAAAYDDVVFGSLLEAQRAAVWSARIDDVRRFYDFTLPRDTVGSVLRVQLESSSAGYLSLAEVQVFGARRETLAAFDSQHDAVRAPRAVEPFQANEPLGECFAGHAFDGEWRLAVRDDTARSVDEDSQLRPFAQHGRGGLSDWLLLLTDLAGRQHEFRMDRYVSVATLPKFGSLEVGGVPVEERSDLVRQLDICYGVDGSGGDPRHCADNFGVGVAVRPRRLGSGARHNELRASNSVDYVPNADYAGEDQFSFSVTHGVHTSEAEVNGRVRLRVRDCRPAPAAVDEPHELCACNLDRYSPSFNATGCVAAVTSVCAGSLADDYAALCELCADPDDAVREMGLCATYVDRAYDEVVELELCETPTVPRCEADWVEEWTPEPFMLD